MTRCSLVFSSLLIIVILAWAGPALAGDQTASSNSTRIAEARPLPKGLPEGRGVPRIKPVGRVDCYPPLYCGGAGSRCVGTVPGMNRCCQAWQCNPPPQGPTNTVGRRR